MERLSRYHQIQLSVTGRKTGKTISNPVWFVLEGEKLYLLPVKGSDTQWYKNVLNNPLIRIDARGSEAKLQAIPVTAPQAVKSVIEPSGTGTRSDVPSRRPVIADSTSPVALAAPVDVGTMLIAAALERLRSLWARSRRFWSLV